MLNGILPVLSLSEKLDSKKVTLVAGRKMIIWVYSWLVKQPEDECISYIYTKWYDFLVHTSIWWDVGREELAKMHLWNSLDHALGGRPSICSSCWREGTSMSQWLSVNIHMNKCSLSNLGKPGKGMSEWLGLSGPWISKDHVYLYPQQEEHSSMDGNGGI